MPCSDSGRSGFEDREEMQQRLDHVTSLLCSQANALLASDRGPWILPEVVAWFRLHQKIDEERIANEEAQRVRQIVVKQQKIKELQAEIERLGR